MSESPLFRTLIDAAQSPISEVLGSDDPNLDLCIARLVASLDDPDGIISAFQSFASDS